MRAVRALLVEQQRAGNTLDCLRQILRRAASMKVNLRELRAGKSGEHLAEDIRTITSTFDPHLVFLVSTSQTMSPVERFLGVYSTQSSRAPVILIAQQASPEALERALELGITDFITPPVRDVNVLPRLSRWCPGVGGGETDPLLTNIRSTLASHGLIGKSRKFLRALEHLPQIAGYDATVLLTGESGTGKEVVARAIHDLSPRGRHAFVPVNCGAIPNELLENELFGHERGAYTGAARSQKGLVAEADKGTLFLDEIDSLPKLAQSKILRFLQEKEYRPLGSAKSNTADTRIIAATNARLEREMDDGRFRVDLFYRLNVVSLELPPIKDRPEDILPLASYFLRIYAAKFNKPITAFSPAVRQLLLMHDWRGNVRELENVVERASIMATDTIIRTKDITFRNNSCCSFRPESFKEAKSRVVKEFEKGYIEQSLVTWNGNITSAAKAAGKNRRAFWELIRKHQIDPSRFREDSAAISEREKRGARRE